VALMSCDDDGEFGEGYGEPMAGIEVGTAGDLRREAGRTVCGAAGGLERASPFGGRDAGPLVILGATAKYRQRQRESIENIRAIWS
jgi:hypothetical protein